MVAKSRVSDQDVAYIVAESRRGVSAPAIGRGLAARGVILSHVAIRGYARAGTSRPAEISPEDAPQSTITGPDDLGPGAVFDAVALIDREIQRTTTTADEAETDAARTAATMMLLRLVEARHRLAPGTATGAVSILDALGRILADEA